MPRFTMSSTRAAPTALFMLDCGLCTTMVLVSRTASTSESSRWMQWIAIVDGPSPPASLRRWMTRLPCFLTLSSWSDLSSAT